MSMTRTLILLLNLPVPWMATPIYGQDPDYPAARRGEVVDTLHGVAIPDPYRWLEDLQSPETDAFAAAQNEVLDVWLAKVPERDLFRQRIAEIADVERNGPFYLRAGRTYLSSMDAGLALTRVDLLNRDGATRPLFQAVDVIDEADDRLAGYVVDPTGSRAAIAIARGQSRWSRVQILELDGSATLYPETLIGIRAPVVWDGTGEGFFYVRYDPPEAGQELTAMVRNPRLFHHRLGTSQAEDRLVYEDPEHPDGLLWAMVTQDGRWLVIHSAAGGTFTGLADRILIADLTGASPEPRLLLEREGAGFAAVEATVGLLYFRTDIEAPRGRILRLDPATPDPDSWTEVVPEAEGTLTGANVVGDRLVVQWTEDARPRLTIHDLGGRLLQEVRLPDIGSVGPVVGGPEDRYALFGFSSLTEVGSVYRLDVASGEVGVLRRPAFAFDPDDFVTEQVFYESADGTRVPMFVAHRRDRTANGSAPGFLYAYGAFAWVAFPWFQPHVIAFLERGGVYALPNVRGGGEYGESWHRAGMRRNKDNAIADYLAAAEWLVESGWVRPGGLVGNGGSASGVLAAAAVPRRPDLFGAMVIDIPALDQLRYHLFTGAASWIPEFGSADDPDDFRALLAYSPYHNLKPGVCLPPTLLIVGEKDEVAPPLHGYKYVARLQHVQECANPTFLRTIPGAGHSYGSDAEEYARTWGDAWAFVERVLESPTTQRAANR
ncbi:MAG TPA: prolyl oligopeptidase family serine peptidase [Gemmatimonadota bacterium]|nr:prolyl oligopeptidase family serine peptidase [Gemmatimonadota bacterium]